MPKLPSQKIHDLLVPYGVDASPELCSKIQTYIDLLLEWNERTSLTTVTDPEQIVRFHFGESMFAASAVPIRNGRLADVGSGAGFPAIPLSMVNTTLITVPIESNSKKSTFQSEIARRLSLPSVRPHRGRMEDMSPVDSHCDWVTARALGNFDALLEWSHAALESSNGSLVLWLGADDANDLASRNEFAWREPIKIPDSDRRYLLVGHPA